MDHKKKAHAISSLRRGTYKWSERWKAEKRSHIDRGLYLCENPECGQLLKKNQTQMDHVIPVVDPEKGWNGFDSFVDRLYVNADMWQRLCETCHSVKTKNENLIRKETKKQAKKEKP